MRRLPAALLCLACHCPAWADPAGPLVFSGMCDASAAVALDDDCFVVANDEDNLLRCYRVGQPGAAVQTFDLAKLLGLRKKAREMDLEGAAWLGDHIFWISSHGRNADGEWAEDRHKLFAVEMAGEATQRQIRLVGRVCTDLLTRLVAEPKLARFKLDQAARRAPKDGGGLNIEALTGTTDGALLIGFRNPIPEGRALVVPLLNPDALIRGGAAEIGDPLLLDLGGLGLRGMETLPEGFLLIGGPASGEGPSRLFSWKGIGSAPEPLAHDDLGDLNPEAVCYRGSDHDGRLLVLSDDGTRRIDGKECKDLRAAERRFRACRVATGLSPSQTSDAASSPSR